MTSFEVFTKALLPLKRQPTITIQKNGVLSLNLPSLLALGSPQAVELLYNAVERIVGLRGVDPAVAHSRTVRSVAGPGAAPFVISAGAFLRFYDIEHAVSRRWEAYLVDEILCLDLDGACVPVTSNRAGSSRHRAVTGEYNTHE